MANNLKREMADMLESGSYYVSGADDRSQHSHFYRYQIIQTARALDYYANTSFYRAWVRLVLRNTNRTEMLIAFHGIGREFHGLLACSVSWFQRVETDDGEREMGPAIPLSDRHFLIDYKESVAAVRSRFHDWLEDAIVRCLNQWQDAAL